VGRRIEATHRVILRDAALCRVPGCSRAADHVHHVVLRSACGPLEPWNELSRCGSTTSAACTPGTSGSPGRCPEGLRFVLGEREVARARV